MLHTHDFHLQPPFHGWGGGWRRARRIRFSRAARIRAARSRAGLLRQLSRLRLSKSCLDGRDCFRRLGFLGGLKSCARLLLLRRRLLLRRLHLLLLLLLHRRQLREWRAGVGRSRAGQHVLLDRHHQHRLPHAVRLLLLLLLHAALASRRPCLRCSHCGGDKQCGHCRRRAARAWARARAWAGAWARLSASPRARLASPRARLASPRAVAHRPLPVEECERRWRSRGCYRLRRRYRRLASWARYVGLDDCRCGSERVRRNRRRRRRPLAATCTRACARGGCCCGCCCCWGCCWRCCCWSFFVVLLLFFPGALIVSQLIAQPLDEILRIGALGNVERRQAAAISRANISAEGCKQRSY